MPSIHRIEIVTFCIKIFTIKLMTHFSERNMQIELQVVGNVVSTRADALFKNILCCMQLVCHYSRFIVGLCLGDEISVARKPR